MRRALDGLYLGAGYLAGLFLIAIFALMLAMSAGRPLGLNLQSGDDLVAWCMASCAFLGLAHTFKAGEMIRVGLLFDRLRGRVRTVAELLCLSLAVVMIGFFAWHGLRLVYFSWKFQDMSHGVLAVPLWIPQVGFAAGLVILFIAIVDELVRVLAGLQPSYARDRLEVDGVRVERIAEEGA